MKTESRVSMKNALLGMLFAGLSFCTYAGAAGKSTPAGFTDDFEAARAEAATSGKMMLAVFSGSDWCHWCKVLEKDYLSKPDFVEEAKKDFVLVFIDSPQDKSILSETAARNNERLVKEYKISGFPTVKILKADGGEVADSRPKGGVEPKDYAEQLRRDAKVGPLVKKHLAPFEDELKKAMEDAFMELSQKMPSNAKEGDSDAAEKAQFELSQKMAVGLVEKYKAIRAKMAAAKVPAEIETEKVSMLEKIDVTLMSMEQMLKMSWEDVKKIKGRSGTNRTNTRRGVQGLVVPLPKDA